MGGLTFKASGLDRAALLRRDENAVTNATSVLPIWRGKIALSSAGAPLWRPAHDPIFAAAAEPSVFLGIDDGVPRYGRDLSDWKNDDDAPIGAFLDPSVQVHPSMPDGAGFHELRSVMTRLTPRDAELVATAKALTGWHLTHRFCSACGAPSVPAEGGWLRVCPVCSTRHFPRTDPVVIMLVTHGNDLLVGRSPGWPEGMYSLLAGFVEPGETLEAAAAREVFEEAQIELGPVHYLACQPWPFPSSLMIGVAAEATSRAIKVDPEELEDAIWLPREEVLETLSGTHPRIRAARKGAIARAMIEDWVAGRIEA